MALERLPLDGEGMLYQETPDVLAVHVANRPIYHPYVMVDPFTWGWVAEKLAAGAVGWLGGKILASLLGEANLEDVVARGVAELKTFIRAELDSREVREVENEFRALRRDLFEWANAQNTSDGRLENATTKSNELLARIEGRGPETKGIYVDLVSLRLFVLIARRRRYNEPGEWTNMVTQVLQSKPIVLKWLEDAEAYWTGRWNGVRNRGAVAYPGRRSRPRVDDPGYPGHYRGIVDDNGEEIATREYGEDSGADAEAEANTIYVQRRTAYELILVDFRRRVKVPCLAVIAHWDAVALEAYKRANPSRRSG